MPNCTEFASLITGSGFIEHMKAVARGKLKGLLNSAVEDAIIDGGSIKWEYFPRFHDKSDKEIYKMTVTSSL